MSQSGPGLLLQHLTRKDLPAVEAGVAVIGKLDADVLLLTGFDYDYDGSALAALQDRLRGQGLDYPYALALRPNTGVPTGLDLNHDGALNGPRDAQAYGRFAGQAGMALLSRLPIDRAGIRDFTGLLWANLPGADLPPDLTPEARALQRLSTSGHYEIPLTYAPGKTLRLLVWAATPPVFDGPEDRNGRRNADETALWLHLLQGDLPQVPASAGPYPPPQAPFVVMGEANLDPQDGEGKTGPLRALLSLLQDPAPRGTSGHTDAHHKGDPALDTAYFAKSHMGLRLDYILPSKDIGVTAASVMWPPDSDPFAATLATASRHYPASASLTLP
ncbi:endonuclease/exonuclease/phosphatase family protein [bacterium]|nr:endonuclease/exonuclease/phosphatase family protein [bacterium]